MSWNEEIQLLSKENIRLQYRPNKRFKALVGDYSKDIALNTNSVLKSLGFETEFVSNGRDLIKKVISNENEYDVLITNNIYYKEAGEQILYELKKKEIKVPIIVATGTINSKSEFLKKGFDGYIEKPLTLENTKQEMMRVLKNVSFTKI